MRCSKPPLPMSRTPHENSPDPIEDPHMPDLPAAARYVVIGAGVHGLSTSMHLAQRLRAAGKTVGASGTRIVVLDKTGIGAGASGIACGVVRNNYYQPAMRELMAHSVSVWERDPA